MFHVWWPATAVLTFLIMLVIMIILMYGDKICKRVQSRPVTMVMKAPRNHGPSREEIYTGHPPPQHQHHQQHQQQPQVHYQYERPLEQQQHHEYPREHQQQYQEREVGGVEMHYQQHEQPQYPKKTFSREVEV